ncbi:hypothetical protein DPMN_026429 [Dreissena polymorpha]|uniref:Uncharacterized protein n=1 Tax=Dreissena polymorpha TaxID=45954 RepID=A0A9D4LSJ4_DREPO|nr:hypothetical protein DPMN_026429 [Dreissena polymorpha]
MLTQEYLKEPFSAHSCSCATYMTSLIQSSHKYDSSQTIAPCTGPYETFSTT